MSDNTLLPDFVIPQLLIKEVCTTSPILRFLDSREVPWQTSHRDLVAQFGLTKDRYYGNDYPDYYAVELATPMQFLAHMLAPLSINYANCEAAPDLAPRWFSGKVYETPDSLMNLQSIISELTPHLGKPSPSDNAFNNTHYELRWDEPGIACLSATIWKERPEYYLKEKPYKEYPFLLDACTFHLTISGISPPSSQQIAWVSSFKAVYQSPKPFLLPGEGEHLSNYYIHYPNGPFPDNTIGISDDGQALIFTLKANLYYAIPREEILGFKIITVPSERGEADSFSVALCMRFRPLKPTENPTPFEANVLIYETLENVTTMANTLKETVGLHLFPSIGIR